MQCNQTRCFQALSEIKRYKKKSQNNIKTNLFPLSFWLIFTPSPFSRFHPQFLASFLCALTLERSQKVSILFAEEEIKLRFWPRCVWSQSRGSMKLGSGSRSPPRLSAQQKRLGEETLTCTWQSPRRASSPPLVGVKVVLGSGDTAWLIQEQWWNSL